MDMTPEISQEKMPNLMVGLGFVCTYLDDQLIISNSTFENHLYQLHAFLLRLTFIRRPLKTSRKPWSRIPSSITQTSMKHLKFTQMSVTGNWVQSSLKVGNHQYSTVENGAIPREITQTLSKSYSALGKLSRSLETSYQSKESRPLQTIRIQFMSWN